MSAPTATVIRNEIEKIIPASEVVIGDLVILTSGDMVPTDMRLIQAVNLKIAEASLTGESIASEKNASVVLTPDCPLRRSKEYGLYFLHRYLWSRNRNCNKNWDGHRNWSNRGYTRK